MNLAGFPVNYVEEEFQNSPAARAQTLGVATQNNLVHAAPDPGSELCAGP